MAIRVHTWRIVFKLLFQLPIFEDWTDILPIAFHLRKGKQNIQLSNVPAVLNNRRTLF